MIDKIKSKFEENIKVHEKAKEKAPQIKEAAELLINSLDSDNKVLLCGNGGSAADAQHIAGELVGRFKKEREAIPAVALTTDASIMTAVSNDYWYDLLFARQVEALGEEGDALIGISTSGNSTNVVRAVEKANSQDMKTIGLLGKDGGKLKDLVDAAIVVPSEETDRIQEVHIFIGHILCELIESNL